MDGSEIRTKKNLANVAVGDFCGNLNQSIVHFIWADHTVTVFIQLFDHVSEIGGVFGGFQGIQMNSEI